MEKDWIYLASIIFISFIILILFQFSIFLKVGIIVLLFLIYSTKYIREFIWEQELENNFPKFLKDLSQYLEIGQPLNVAINSLKNNDYGYLLNNYIKSIISYMNYGYTFIEALNKVASKVKNRNISEAIYSITEALNRGGDISGLLNSLSESFEHLYEIKKDRLSQIRLLIFTYYGLFIAIVFIVYLSYYFVTKMIVVGNSGNILYAYKYISFILLLVNSIFTGLVIGKVSTGRVISGIYHSIILTLITLAVFFLIF